MRSEGAVNCFLLCAVVAKQTRRLGRLMPDRQTPELITIALKNCAHHELELDLDAGAPEVVRQEAMQIGRLTKYQEPTAASSLQRWERSQIANAVLATGGQDAAGDRAAHEPSLLGESAIGTHLSRQEIGRHTNHPFLAKVRLALTFLWAAVSIVLILAAIYTVFKGNIR